MKIKPPIFDGEKYGEIAEIWFLEMKKYLQLHDYYDNQEAWIAIYNPQRKDYRWWKQLKQVENLDENKISGGVLKGISSVNTYHNNTMIRK